MKIRSQIFIFFILVFTILLPLEGAVQLMNTDCNAACEYAILLLPINNYGEHGKPSNISQTHGLLPAGAEYSARRQLWKWYWRSLYTNWASSTGYIGEVRLEDEWAIGFAEWQSKQRLFSSPILIIGHRLENNVWSINS